MQLADLMIHVNENLAAGERTSLEERMRELEGVVAPRFCEGKPHLLMVSYNAEVTDSGSLLRHVEADGYHVQLVGM